MTVLFHGNFALNRERMAGVLRASLSNPKLKDAELAKPFGYGAPFGALYRSWLHKTGMTKMEEAGKATLIRPPRHRPACVAETLRPLPGEDQAHWSLPRRQP